MTATAEKATFNPQNETLTLTGSPRVVQSGLVLAAEIMRLNRRSGEAAAEGDVKTTYNEVRPQAGGAMLATADPIHVTAERMTANRNVAVARYSGGARLWQGANIVEAPVIEFDRDRRRIVASSSGARRVLTVFVQDNRTGRATPVTVTATRLSYEDSERQAQFEGGVILKGADVSITADRADVRLQPRGQKSGAATASQVEEITAVGHIAIEQPSRKATGERLVYTTYDGRFVLTGGPPSIFDAEHGRISGDSLTFYSRDGRVLVGSRDSSRTVTHTRVDR
jgi:lipopolysaccharide export system protein LptA